MKAVDAAKMVNEKPKTVEEIEAVIPDYPCVLHRNQWVATFLKNLSTPALREQFAALRKPAAKAAQPTTA